MEVQPLGPQDSDVTGLFKHFWEGCPIDNGRVKRNIRISLIDFMDTTERT